MLPNSTFSIIYEIIPMIILFSVIVILLKIVIALLNHERLDFYSDFKMLLYIIYLFVLFQLVTSTDFESYSNNFIPFHEIMRYKPFSPLFIRNVIGNILLFLPFGYATADFIYINTKKKSFFIPLLFTLLTSITIETIQMYIGRSFDIDDIILNFAGGLIGTIIFFILKTIFKENNIFNKIIKVILTLLMGSIIILWMFKLKGEL